MVLMKVKLDDIHSQYETYLARASGRLSVQPFGNLLRCARSDEPWNTHGGIMVCTLETE